MNTPFEINPELDLVFERNTHLTPEQLWQGWTDEQTLMKWFCPKPWKVTECRIDLKAGGEFFNLMQGPNGEQSHNHGCFLEVIPQKKLVWTGVLKKDFRPTTPNPMGFEFVVTVLIRAENNSTNYKAIVAHSTAEGRKKHEDMGFQQGWGMAFDQLVELF